MKIRVELHCESNSMHLAQLYTGFGELAKAGIIDCEWVFHKGVSASPYTSPRLRVSINDDLMILYDQNDDYRISDDIDLNQVDLVFKRSFNPSYVATHPHHDRILPLGLNYYVLGQSDMRLARILHSKNDRHKLRALLKYFLPYAVQRSFNTPTYLSTIRSFESVPYVDTEPRVLFVAQLWRPNRVHSEELKQDRERINEMRISLVRLLKREFRERFVGGLIPNNYTEQYFQDLVVSDPSTTKKGNFLELVKKVPICVTSTGLIDSIGYKFTEFVAASRAIVAEVNANHIYGDFEIGRNYLTFKTAEQCVTEVQKLFDNPSMRANMMRSNFIYYQLYVRPDMLVLNSMRDALQYTQAPV